MLSQAVEKNAQQQLKNFLRQFKSLHGTHISQQGIADLVKLLRCSANIATTFNKDNPLSVMETITIVLHILNASDNDIADILGISCNTVKSYMGRIKEKLLVTKRSEAIMKLLRAGIIKIIY